jgi:lipid-A-disaccharide synthase
VIEGRSHVALAAADAVLTACGTATLEALLHKRPMVAAYRMAPLSWAVMSRLLRIPWVALPNILAGERLVPELLQDAVHPAALADARLDVLRDDAGRRELVRRFEALHRELRCSAAERAADAVLALARGEALS